MHKLIELLTDGKKSWINEILIIFKPLLSLLAVDNEFFNLKKVEFEKIIENPKSFLTHPFHIWFQNLLKNVIILDGQAVYDTIRDLFLNRFALQSPNCLACPDEHGCCHNTYSIEHIDYKRIIANKLIDPSFISRFRSKYKLKLVKDSNGNKHCAAFDVSTKKCLIHQFKPPTCCKYPLISNVHEWSAERMAWTGNCAHHTEVWVTRVHPAIMNVCRDLWVYAHLLWESEQSLWFRLKKPLDTELKEILSRILALKQCNWIYKNAMLKKILLEDYSESVVITALRLMKKF